MALVEPLTVAHTWTINDFKRLHESRTTANSKEFAHSGDDASLLRFSLRLYNRDVVSNRVELHAHLAPPYKQDRSSGRIVWGYYCVLDSNGNETNIQRVFSKDHRHADTYDSFLCLSFTPISAKEIPNLMSLLQADGSLKIFAKFTYFDSPGYAEDMGDGMDIADTANRTSASRNRSVSLRSSLAEFHPRSLISQPPQTASTSCQTQETGQGRDTMMSSNESLLTSGFMSDCTLVVDNEQFQANKCILGSRSSVFKAMFSSNYFSEGQDSQVKITDANPPAVRIMLQWMYNCHADLPGDLNTLMTVLSLAQKYDLAPLKLECERTLKNRLSVGNVFDIYTIANAYVASELKKSCISYVAQNILSAMASDGWSSFKQREGTAALQLFEQAIMSQHTTSTTDALPPTAAQNVPMQGVDDVDHPHGWSSGSDSSVILSDDDM